MARLHGKVPRHLLHAWHRWGGQRTAKQLSAAVRQLAGPCPALRQLLILNPPAALKSLGSGAPPTVLYAAVATTPPAEAGASRACTAVEGWALLSRNGPLTLVAQLMLSVVSSYLHDQAGRVHRQQRDCQQLAFHCS